MHGCIDPGSLIEVRGQRWLLTRTQRFDGCAVLSLEGRGRGNAMERMQVIEPFDRPRPVSGVTLRRRRRHAVLEHALTAIHAVNPIDGLWTAASARLDLHAYQLEPALAALGGTTRLLLADAVGLGKTIQAGLLLSELDQRGWIERSLIVCPAGLRDTWCRELRERFGIAATILDQPEIANRITSFPPGVNPWAADRVVIVSIDFIKRDEVMAAVAGVPIDLLIADEAHHLTPGSDRGRAVAALAARAAWCVLVSATPHSGDRAAFQYLVDLGSHSDDIAVFRRSRHDIGLGHTRRVTFFKVQPEQQERALFAAIQRYSRAIWAARGQSEHAARLVAMTIARRASSSTVAVRRTLLRRRELIGASQPESAQPRLPWEDLDDADGDEDASLLSVLGLHDVHEEQAALEELISLASKCETAAKLNRLQRLLLRINEPALVFTEYRDTLETIVDALRRRHRVTSIHGAMPRDMRTSAVDAFNGGSVDVLVATDAAGEGLNLHHRCRLVVDYELPWNPLRLEQRLGRVDRIGQHRSVHAIRLYHDGTIEQDVLERLALRRGHAERDLARAVSECDVAAAVFTGNDLAACEAAPLPPCAIAAAAAEELRVSRRRLAADRASSSRCCFAIPRHGGAQTIRVLHRKTFVNAFGVTVGDQVIAHDVSLTNQPSSLTEWRIALAQTVGLVSPGSLVEVTERRSVHRRINAIRAHIARHQRREYQRSLFDGREDDGLTNRQRVAAHLDAALIRIDAAISPPDPALTRVDVVAAWPNRRA